MKSRFLKTLAAATIASSALVSVAQAADSLYIPNLSYRTGPFGGNGIRVANGYADYFNMLNERDGGIGGVKVVVEECETGYNSQKGVECYEATKGKGALVSSPWSTGITLQLIPKAPVDKIPVLSMGYGLSAAAIGDQFPWVFNPPATYWGQMSAILGYIAKQSGGKDLSALKGKKIGFIYLDAGYGREPLPMLEQLSAKYNFELLKVPVGVKEMQNQSSHWLTVRKEKPDWMIMWGWGAMNSTAVKAAIKVRYPMNRFIGNWWSSANVDTESAGKAAKGYLGATYSAEGTSYPAVQDILKYVVAKGKSQVKDKGEVGTVLYNRGVVTAAFIAEAIRSAQKISGKKVIDGSDMRKGLENVNMDEARIAQLGLKGATVPIKTTCADHAGSSPVIITQWDGEEVEQRHHDARERRDRSSDAACGAAKFVKENKGWQTQTCK
ncbi:MAG: ABC transporter substrate-binding protein [Burkholderiaceae bacterium]